MLGVARDAAGQQIKKSFRRLARELHPDVNAHDPDAEEKFKEAAEAYEILSDDERRATYDRYGHEGLRSRRLGPNFDGFGSISDLFEAFFGGVRGGFGGHGGGPSRATTRSSASRSTWSKRRAGRSVQVSYEAVDAASTATARAPSPGRRSRHVRALRRLGRAAGRRAHAVRADGAHVACDACHGEGRVAEQPCRECAGAGGRSGRASSRSTFPRASRTASASACPAAGTPASTAARRATSTSRCTCAPHERLIRDGDDLVTVLDVPAPLAALGADLPAASLDGETEVHVPTGTQPGEIVTVRARGCRTCVTPTAAATCASSSTWMIPRRLDGRAA